LLGHLVGDFIFQNDWMALNKTNSSKHCLVHSLAYALAVFLCTFWWLPIWTAPIIAAAHFPMDRWRLARKWMVYVSGQKVFAEGIFAPWSVIVVDNVFHLLVLFVISLLAV
jgi:hypothetical protein